MPMAIDQAGNNGTSAAIDPLRLFRTLALRRKVPDMALLNQYVSAFPQFKRLAVKVAQVGQEQWPRRILGVAAAGRQAEAGEHSQCCCDSTQELAPVKVGFDPPESSQSLGCPAATAWSDGVLVV